MNYHCQVCNIDTLDYFEHLAKPEHHVNYMKEMDNDDGVLIVHKIDLMLQELENNLPQPEPIIQNMEKLSSEKSVIGENPT